MDEYCSDCAKRCKKCGTPLATYETPKTPEPVKRDDGARRPGRPKKRGDE